MKQTHWTASNLEEALKKTRQEGAGISIPQIATIIKKVLAPEEVRALIKNL